MSNRLAAILAANEAELNRRVSNVCEDRRTLMEKTLDTLQQSLGRQVAQTSILSEIRDLLRKQNKLWDEYAARESMVKDAKSFSDLVIKPFTPGDVVIDSRDGNNYVVMAYNRDLGTVKVLGKSADISTKFFVLAGFRIQL